MNTLYVGNILENLLEPSHFDFDTTQTYFMVRLHSAHFSSSWQRCGQGTILCAHFPVNYLGSGFNVNTHRHQCHGSKLGSDYGSASSNRSG